MLWRVFPVTAEAQPLNCFVLESFPKRKSHVHGVFPHRVPQCVKSRDFVDFTGLKAQPRIREKGVVLTALNDVWKRKNVIR